MAEITSVRRYLSEESLPHSSMPFFLPFQVSPQHLNEIQIWALTRPFQYSPFCFKPVLGGFTGMFCVIVLLQDPVPLQLNFFYKLQPLIHSRIHDGEQARSCCNKITPNQDTSTSMFFSWYEVPFLECCIWFMSNMSSVVVSK